MGKLASVNWNFELTRGNFKWDKK